MDLPRAVVIDFASERLALLPERAVYNPRSGDLFIADLHLGKSATFREKAIPVPEGDTRQDLNRLGEALERTEATRLVVLGDFLHGSAAHRDTEWKAWRSSRPDLAVTVVRGNHDVTAGDPPGDWGVNLVQEPFRAGGLVLRHHPDQVDDGGVLAGHLHPAVRLRGAGRDRISLPCFLVGPQVMVLPAFTAFSGRHPVSARAGDRVFAIAEDTVLDVTALAA